MSPTDSSVWTPGTAVEESPYLWKGEPVFHEPLEANGHTDAPTLLELFCGAGGTSIGFEMAGFRTLLGADILVPAIETFRHNHPSAWAVQGDLRRVEQNRLKRALEGIRTDVLVGGVPCQGFSLNNRKRHVGDQRNYLFEEFARFLKALRPRAVVLENVSGLVSADEGSFCRAIEKSLAKACGHCVTHRIINAADHGVPQLRRRVIFVGVPKGCEFEWPEPTHGDAADIPHLTVDEAFGDLPALGPGEETDRYAKRVKGDYQRLMRGECKTLANHRAPRHPAATVNKIAATEPGEPIYERFKQRIRLHPDRPSPTQVAGGIRSQYQFGHPDQPRGLTIRERCRLQSFPDHIFIHGGVVQGRVQTGNAVPPLLARAIAQSLRRALDL